MPEPDNSFKACYNSGLYSLYAIELRVNNENVNTMRAYDGIKSAAETNRETQCIPKRNFS